MFLANKDITTIISLFMKLFIIVNVDVFFLSHRKEIAMAASGEGFEVTVITKNTGKFSEIQALGLKTIDLPINPTGMHLPDEMKTFHFLLNTFRKEKPDIVHLVGLKCILWGGMASRLANVKGVVSAYSGLGILFQSEKLSPTAKAILKLFKFSHSRRDSLAIFQNHDDEKLFLDNKVLKPSQVRFIKGSGVDLNEFPFSSDPNNEKVRVIFTARMVKEKGVIILTDAAEKLREEYLNKIEFLLCGGLSENPDALSEDELNSHCDGSYIKWLGYRDDVRELLISSNIVAFPSYYREGVPKSLIEACAIGRPIITTDSVGCRDVVEDGLNGFLIPIKDSKALAEKLKILIDNPSMRSIMGRKSREIAECDFSLDGVVEKHINIYRELCKN